MKKYFGILLSFILMLMLYGCNINWQNYVSLSVTEKEVVLEIGESKQITATVKPTDTTITWKSSDPNIATVSDVGLVTGISIGTTWIEVKASSITKKVKVEVVEKIIEPVSIEIIGGEKEMEVGDYLQLEAILLPEDAVQIVEWSTTDSEILTVDNSGKVIAVSPGEAWIVATSIVKPTLSKSIKIEVLRKMTDEELQHNKIMNIMSKMTIEEKIGQMFMVGFDGITVPSSLKQAIKNKHFGNFIYFGVNVTNPKLVAKMSKELQNLVMNENGIPAFISIDQEGGMVVRFVEEATHFIGSMGLVATGNSQNAYQVGRYSGLELLNYGINNNLAPSLDVNNNPQNSVIGIRSYSDNPQVVTEYGLQMIQGLKDSNVMATVKHFPGHGDTSVDSHYGLPIINHNKERLYQVELAPFIEAIKAGVDSIMSAHIIFSAVDNEQPATLSYKVLTELLREELGYNGIIITDEMRMSAIYNNFGQAEAAILAVQAGADILLYSESTSTSLVAYDAVLQAVRNNVISEERVNESVYRILSKKMKYGLMDEAQDDHTLSEDDFAFHSAYNKAFIEQSITLAKGNVDWFDNNRSTLLISPKCSRYPLLPGLSLTSTYNTLAYVGKTILQERGATNVNYYVIETNISTSEINSILTLARNYDQVVIAVENVSASQANLINQLGRENLDLLVVALRTPYDYLSYTSVSNYVCTYGYYPETVEAIMGLLLGDFQAKGVLPVKVTGLN